MITEVGKVFDIPLPYGCVWKRLQIVHLSQAVQMGLLNHFPRC